MFRPATGPSAYVYLDKTPGCLGGSREYRPTPHSVPREIETDRVLPLDRVSNAGYEKVLQTRSRTLPHVWLEFSGLVILFC